MPFTTTRRHVLLAGTAAGATIAMPWVAKAAPEFSFKYANNSPLTHPLTVRTMEAMERIKQETNGRVDIQVFPNNQLGSDTDMLSQLRSGALEFFTLSGLILSTWCRPRRSTARLHLGELRQGVAGDGRRSRRLCARRRSRSPASSRWRSSTTTATARSRRRPRPIKTPEDLKGFKIRVPPSPLWTSMFKAFDASPMSINFSEIYSALQTKVAEGQENPLVDHLLRQAL